MQLNFKRLNSFLLKSCSKYFVKYIEFKVEANTDKKINL